MRKGMGKRMITAVILAAGESLRLGSPKQMVLFRGKTLLAHAIETALASKCNDVMVVIGAHAVVVRPTAVKYKVRIVENPNWTEGKSSSIRTAVDAVVAQSDDTSGILFLTCDQPHVTPDILDLLVARFEVSNEAPVACAYSGTIGIPAIIPRRMFPDLMKLHGDDGARTILQSAREEIVTVEFAMGSFDVDSVEDVKQITGGK